MKFYMFRTVPLSIIRSFSLYTQQWDMSYRCADSCSQLVTMHGHMNVKDKKRYTHVYVSGLPYVCTMHCPDHPPLCNHSNYIFLGNKTTKILSKKAPVSSFYFLPLRSQNSPPHPFNFSSTLFLKK